ncbi:potassium channel family protein [Corynebacterium terpenotabidum]|uniref:Kef-type K+ transport systems, NAD-binding component n=1 Tax=Corynebacterium terpenotabidum Y-11 TaxID=1200352 RepID=S4XB28_9CORY|nr:potassium channel family protein [Corynebacterium terpenotabidum]AGP30332.1 Kef-type K+ transport systems, NAD-binding component [Corynebacterium terpenotabidum Y-11]
MTTTGPVHPSPDFGPAVARWERYTEWPLLGVALLFFGAYALEIVDRTDPRITSFAEIVLRATWAIFAVDYLVRLSLAQHRTRWFTRHLLDLMIVVLPMFRPLRLMRFVTVIALVQRSTGTMLRGRVIAYTVGSASLTVLVAALAVLDAEEGQGTIDTFGQSLWWAFSTMTTVGYGDYAPVTGRGRIIATVLMIGGITIIGAVTGTLSSWIVERVAEKNERAERVTAKQVRALHKEIIGLRADLAEVLAERHRQD